MNVASTLSTKPSAHEWQHVSDVYGGTATSPTLPPTWPSVSHSVSSAPSPSQSPIPGAQIGHAERFPLAAAVVLGFLLVSALFWSVWLALRKRRRDTRAYPEFASVHPELARVYPKRASVPEADENPRDEKEDDPFDARASSARSMASTMSV